MKKLAVVLVLLISVLGFIGCELFYSLSLNGEWTLNSWFTDEAGEDITVLTDAGSVYINIPTFQEINNNGEIQIPGTVSELTDVSFLRTRTDNNTTQFVSYSIVGNTLTLKFYTEDQATFWGGLICTR